jgi:transcriptional regulator with XRE-family HTH domain
MGNIEQVKRKYRARVMECRLRAQIPTKKELAKRTGIAPSIVSDLESGKLFLSSPYALMIKEALGCSLDDLFEDLANARKDNRNSGH